MSAVTAIFITHTPDRIGNAVRSMGRQMLPPEHIVVSCDSDHPGIRDEVEKASDDIGRPVLLVLRGHMGEARPAQTRNNAVRALMGSSAFRDGQSLVFFDGDCMAPPGTLAGHAEALKRSHVCLGWRVELDQEQTDRIDSEVISSGRLDDLATPEQIAEVVDQQRKHRKRLRYRVLGLAKPHKPQVLGANFACRAWVYRALNGMDETFTGWGMEDDDFGRRAYTLGAHAALHLDTNIVLHQHHETRSRGKWRENSRASRLAMPFSARCRHGLVSPLEQSEPVVELVGG